MLTKWLEDIQKGQFTIYSQTTPSGETINNLDIVQSLNYEKDAQDVFDRKNKELQKEGEVAQFSASWVNPSFFLRSTIRCPISFKHKSLSCIISPPPK